MNKLITRMTRRYTPKMNDLIMRGLASESMKHFEEYLDEQIRSICVGLPDNFKYLYLTRCRPEEEFEIATKVCNNNRRYFELAKTNKYLVRLHFEYTSTTPDGSSSSEILTKEIYLPYVEREGGLLHIAGTEMHMVPVLSDKVFTPSGGSIFVRLAQDLNNFFRMYHTFQVNGVRTTRYVAFAEIYRSSAKMKIPQHEQTTRAKPTLPHYLFAKYGFAGAFSRYLGYVPEVGLDTTITPETHPPERWKICESTKIQPKKTCLDKIYRPTRVRIAIPNEHYNHEAECLITGLFYVLDHFPGRFADISHTNQAKELINKRVMDELNSCPLWMILIGHIRFSGNYPEQRLYQSISDHFDTIGPYLDQATKIKLRENNIELENYFDLLYHIQVNFNKYILENERNGLSVYGKSMEVLQFVAYDILYGFTTMKFRLNKTNSQNGMITRRDAEEALRRFIRMGAMFKLQDGDKLVCEVVGYSGDHLYPKITAIVAEQESQAGGGREANKRVIPGRQHWLDLSMVFMGSMLNLPKANPTPVVRANPWMTVDPKTGTVVPNPKFKDLMEENAPLFKHY